MSLSKLPRHFDEAIKNFVDSWMIKLSLHIQFLFSTCTSPVSFSLARRANELPLRSGLARGLSRDESRGVKGLGREIGVFCHLRWTH